MKRNVVRFFLLGLVSMMLSSCAIINLILQIPGAILKSGIAPVQVVDADADKTRNQVPEKTPLGEDAEKDLLPVVRN